MKSLNRRPATSPLPGLAPWMLAALAAILPAAALATPPDHAFAVERMEISDPKAVFATVESAKVVPARARIGGTLASLLVAEGDSVEAGDTIAVVGDVKLSLQVQAVDAQIAGLQAQQAQAKTDLDRAEELFARGTIPRARLDDSRTALEVATKALEAQQAQRRVITQQRAEGAILAPTSGRVLRVPVTPGTVIMPGEPVAVIAESDYVLRLRLPERHARYLKAGDSIRLATGDRGDAPESPVGRIVTVYPEITDGRVVADARVGDLGDYFVGERVLVWVSTGSRAGFVVPAPYLRTRFGVDFVLVDTGAGAPIEVPVQRGRPLPLPDMPDGVEILSGVAQGDVLVMP